MKETYYSRNKDFIKESVRAYQETHKDEIKKYQKEYNRNYYLQHKDSIRAYQNRHKDEMRKKQKEYYLKHKDDIPKIKKTRKTTNKIPISNDVNMFVIVEIHTKNPDSDIVKPQEQNNNKDTNNIDPFSISFD